MKKTPAGLVRSLANGFLSAMLLALVSGSAQAANGTWSNTSSGGLWSAIANWSGGTVANGAGFTADFSTLNITADNTVHLDSARTLTGLVFGDSTTNTPAGWVLDNNGNAGNTLTLNNSFVQVNSLGGTKVATISAILSGTGSLTKIGVGTLVLSSANTYNGNTLISAGTLTLSGSGAINNSPTVAVDNGATFNVLAGGYTVSAGHILTGKGSVLNGTVNIASGGVLAPGNSGSTGTLTVSGLSLSIGATNNFEFAVGANDLVSVANVNALVFNGGAINLYQVGTTTPFTTPGTYNLFQYSGAIGGTGIGALSVANPQAGLSYTFGSAGGFVTVIISATMLPISPVTLSVHSVDGSILAVHFSDLVQGASANNKTNYTVYSKVLSGAGINVTNATLLSDEQTVVLYVDTPVSEFFAVGVSNVLDLGNSNIVADATGYLGDLFSANIGTAGDPTAPGSVIGFYRDAFQVTASGSEIGGVNDHCQFIFQNTVGDFEAAANFTSLQFTNFGTKAFLMARESTAADARSVAIGFTAVDPVFNTNRVLILARSLTNSAALPFGSPPQLNSLGWLRLTRTNNTFVVYYGSNGIAWTPCGAFTNTVNDTMSVGIAVTSHTNGYPIKASVDSFGLAGTLPGTGIVPTLSVSVYSNNLVAKWQRTPRDFAIQVADNLGAAPSTLGVSNPPPAWAYALFPIFDTTLTGTNAAMPTAGRYMTIPMDLFTNSQMFVRLTQVERVIPDPISVTPGILLSQSALNLNATNQGATLGNYSVSTANTLIPTNGTYVVCGPTNSYTFSTDQSTNIHTVMLLRKYTTPIPTFAALATNVGTAANNWQAMVSLQSNLVTNKYTFVIAATNDLNWLPTPTRPIMLRIDYR